jgi:hypothetical protein
MGNPFKKSLLFVKKSDAKKGKLWNKMADERIIKQHGGYDIPEDDLHAVKRPSDPVMFPKATPEETNEALSEIEKEIQQLKQKP